MTKYARMSNDFCSGMYGILASIWFRAIKWVFDLVVGATWCPPREFDYFRHISDVAVEAGASIDDCENSDIRVTFSGGGMIHSLIHSALFSEDVVFSDAEAMKFELFMAYFVEVAFLSNTGTLVARHLSSMQPNAIGHTQERFSKSFWSKVRIRRRKITRDEALFTCLLRISGRIRIALISIKLTTRDQTMMMLLSQTLKLVLRSTQAKVP